MYSERERESTFQARVTVRIRVWGWFRVRVRVKRRAATLPMLKRHSLCTFSSMPKHKTGSDVKNKFQKVSSHCS